VGSLSSDSWTRRVEFMMIDSYCCCHQVYLYHRVTNHKMITSSFQMCLLKSTNIYGSAIITQQDKMIAWVSVTLLCTHMYGIPCYIKCTRSSWPVLGSAS
jgi:hypothetical protein